MLKYLDELKKKYNMFWFVTITPYGKELESNVPPFKKVIEDFKILSNKIGKNAVAIRYDPILINKNYSVEKHIEMFDIIAKMLKGYTEDVTISFLDLYEKVKKNAPNIRPPTNEEQRYIAKEFVRIGKENNMVIHGCCENPNLKEVGIDIQGCMSQNIVEKAIGFNLKAPSRQSKRIITVKNSEITKDTILSEKEKPICNCLMGNDIGAYNSCMHLCKYCYANYNKELVQENFKHHDPNSPFLIGKSLPEDEVHEVKQKSWKIDNELEQITLF